MPWPYSRVSTVDLVVGLLRQMVTFAWNRGQSVKTISNVRTWPFTETLSRSIGGKHPSNTTETLTLQSTLLGQGCPVVFEGWPSEGWWSWGTHGGLHGVALMLWGVLWCSKGRLPYRHPIYWFTLDHLELYWVTTYPPLVHPRAPLGHLTREIFKHVANRQ
jgi:hypothetical protein